MKKVDIERISDLFFHLDNEKILSTTIHCKKLLERKDKLYIEEFKDISFFFFESNEEKTIEYLTAVYRNCMEEYMKRISN